MPFFCGGNVNCAGVGFTSVPVPMSSTTWGFAGSAVFDGHGSRGCADCLGVEVGGDGAICAGRDAAFAGGLDLEEAFRWRKPEEIVNAELPLLVSVAVSGLALVPSSCVGNVRGVVGENVTRPVFNSGITASPELIDRNQIRFAVAVEVPDRHVVQGLSGRILDAGLKSAITVAQEYTNRADESVARGTAI